MIAGIDFVPLSIMMVHPSQKPCPRPQPPLSLTLSRKGRTRILAIGPLALAMTLLVFLAVTTVVIGSAAYLIYHDDLLATAVSSRAKMQHSYEERIATLRAELDRITSRHVVQTEGVEQQLSTLLQRQALMEERQAELDGLIDKARASGIQLAAATPRLPRARPGDEAEAAPAASTDATPLAYMPTRPTADQAIIDTLLKGDGSGRPSAGFHQTLSDVQSSLDAAQARQDQALDALTAGVEDEAERLSSALMPIGIALESGEAEADEPQGGPYVPATGLHFGERAAAIERRLDEIRLLRDSASAMPLRKPLASLRLSSGFGNRMDPFLKRRAFHAGLDFAAPRGTEVRATAPGTVIAAGPNGGYGIMVEIRHADGVSTRYGHLSKALVKPGTTVEAGTPIGRVGSTGRSTGPHLHYETRRNDEAVNPSIFFKAGRAIDSR